MLRGLIILFNSFIMCCSLFYSLHKLLGEKINFKSYKLYITLITILIIAALNFVLINKFIRILLVTILFMIITKFLFKEKIYKCVVTPVFYQLLVMISESICVLFSYLILKDNLVNFMNSLLGSIVVNVMVSILTVVFVNIKFINKIFNLLLNMTQKIKQSQIILFCLILLIVLNISDMAIYYRIKFEYLFIFNLSVIFICSLIIIYSLVTQDKYNKVYDKYNTTLNSLKEYEDILNKYRISNHENKNQLLTIRNMVSKNNTKVVKYIDMLVENKLKDNDKYMLETAKIPSGGLRGLIYSKILLMNDLNIKYELDISNEVKTFNLIKIKDSTMLDMCQIIGVYIDNAIDESKRIKDKFIRIEMYKNEKILSISISNYFNGNLDINKFGQKGFTTKGKNHGYGLSLTNKIISNNSKLHNEKSINKNVFTQCLKIEI